MKNLKSKLRKSCLSTNQSPNIRRLSTDWPFYSHRFGNRQAARSKNIAGLSVTVPGLSVSVYCRSSKTPDPGTQSVKLIDWPGKFTGLSVSLADRPAKVTDCTVTFPTQSVCHHVQSETPYLGQARYLMQRGLYD